MYCPPEDDRTYTQTASAWYGYDSGTLANNSAGTISKTYTHSSTKSLTTTVSSELQISANYVVAQVNAKLGLSTAIQASYTKSEAFTVTAPAHTTVKYKDGILKRTIRVKWDHTYSNCTVKTVTNFAYLADNYSEAS
ncbi:hypothetical protein BGM09_23965 [Streptomyces sp. CBMA29]|nr:hypothetical protein [Streptomyces sp. CBMA29]